MGDKIPKRDGTTLRVMLTSFIITLLRDDLGGLQIAASRCETWCGFGIEFRRHHLSYRVPPDKGEKRKKRRRRGRKKQKARHHLPVSRVILFYGAHPCPPPLPLSLSFSLSVGADEKLGL